MNYIISYLGDYIVVNIEENCKIRRIRFWKNNKITNSHNLFAIKVILLLRKTEQSFTGNDLKVKYKVSVK
jgi:uncharacterized protein YuzE